MAAARKQTSRKRTQRASRIRGRWSALRSERGQQLTAYAILAAIIGVMASVVWPSITAPGYLSAWDAGGHLLKARFFTEELLPHGHLSGWFPTWHGGFDLFQFYPPLLYYVLGPLAAVINPETALRLVMAGLWLGLVPVTYYFIRSFDVNRVTAAAGCVLLLALNASFGIGLGALYGVGLLPNGLGAIMAIWTLGRLKRDLSGADRSPRQLLLTGFLFGGLVLSHTFSAYWFGVASLLLLLSETVGRRREIAWVVKRYLTMFGVGLLVSAYWWVPLALGIDQMGPTGAVQGSSTRDILSGLLLAKDSGGLVIAGLAAGGLFYLWVLKRYRSFAFFGSTLTVTLLLSINAINKLLPFGAVIGSSQFIRFHAFAAWLLMILAILGLAGLWHWLRRLARPAVSVPVGAIGVILLFCLVVWPTLQIKRGFINVVDNSATQELPAVAEYLRQNQRPGEFILSEFNWESRFYFGSPHFANQRLPAEVGGLWDLDGNFPEGTLGAAKPVLIASTLGQTSYLSTQQDYLRDRGVRFIVTTNPGTQARLQTLPWLEQTYSGRVMSVFELRNFQQGFGLPISAGAQLDSAEFESPNRYTLKFRNPVTVPAATSLALSEHPWLRVTADDRPIPTSADPEHQLRLDDTLQSVRSVEITYDPPASAKLPGVVSSLAIITVLAGLVRPDLLGFLNPRRVLRRGRRSPRSTRQPRQR